MGESAEYSAEVILAGKNGTSTLTYMESSSGAPAQVPAGSRRVVITNEHGILPMSYFPGHLQPQNITPATDLVDLFESALEG